MPMDKAFHRFREDKKLLQKGPSNAFNEKKN